MSEITIPTGYRPKLDAFELQRAIDYVKKTFQTEIAQALNLQRVSAPLFVLKASGLNDNLSGVERPVEFDMPDVGDDAEVVHSLAKWKRQALGRYGFKMGQGLYTDMNAIRRDETLDNIHSIYVDQWDWERIIDEEDRTVEELENTVSAIVAAIANVNHLVQARFPALDTTIRREVTFLTAQDLEDRYPELSPEEREERAAREYGTVFIRGIGGKLRSGFKHGDRAPDYDDWTLNGDIIMWNDVLGRAFELSSMGIRVDAATLRRQLAEAHVEERARLPFHQALLNGELPQTIGGGIGQSRLCMFMLGAAHIGEVQASVWDAKTLAACEAAGIPLL
ncbi:MAG: aspartate--ammonia ligase [Peptoniphilaceae bacterium]|nr:aspartate--ammonia ligase [Peptoniphilaceae bacterium]MDY6085786.1 aspartate--ammonia ligase [Peptoniphilaceae bacterium]